MRKTSELFNEYLQGIGASGEVIIDYVQGTLGLTFHKGCPNDESHSIDLKLLSRGERSSATLAFLLAVGADYKGPFCVVDEFSAPSWTW